MLADAFAADSRLLVCASGIGGWDENDRIRTRRFGEGFFLVGDEWSEVSVAMPPTSAVVVCQVIRPSASMVSPAGPVASSKAIGSRSGASLAVVSVSPVTIVSPRAGATSNPVGLK